MSRRIILTVHLDRELADFVATRVSDRRADAYIRDLIRRDGERVEGEAFDRSKVEVARAFAATSVRLLTTTSPAIGGGNR
ncbi:MAG: addiction module antitoxin [Alphaproteobacteria bacterium]|nr:addiction module antitoxin [Alphaproteobacteria bacterium]